MVVLDDIIYNTRIEMSRRATTFFGRKGERAIHETRLWHEVGMKRQRGWNPLEDKVCFCGGLLLYKDLDTFNQIARKV